MAENLPVQSASQLTVHDKAGNPVYEIVIEADFSRLAECIEQAGLKGKRACIVSDSKTARIYAQELQDILSKICTRTELFVFPEGEQNKTLDTVRSLYAFLIEKEFDRKDFLVALGGGVTGDLTGFAAATYLRGIAFVQVPTTLLAQADSSVGGKTGVDFDGYKNMVGAFCMPKLVYMNVSALKTLDKRGYLSGMGEVVKHGLIRDRRFLDYIVSHAEEIKHRDPGVMKQVALGNCSIKRAVVEEDPTEKGLRRILNFGHTLGHAIEKQLAGNFYHGECVSVGIVAAAYISMRKGYLTEEQVKEVEKILELFELPVRAAFDPEEAFLATRNDKKMQAGSILFILLKSFGEAYTDNTVTDEQMREGLAYVLQSPKEACKEA